MNVSTLSDHPSPLFSLLSHSLLQVAASFSLSRLFGGVPLFGSEFTCDVTSGDVVSGGSLRATVTYTPAAVDTVSVEYLSVECRGAVNETLLKLTGTSTGKGTNPHPHPPPPPQNTMFTHTQSKNTLQ